MRIGLYGGTFDPIHHGHLLLAREALEQLGLDELLFVPAWHSPHKPDIRITPGPIRVEMIRAAIAGEPGLAVDDREIRRGGLSYAIETVRELQTELPDAEFHYLIGADNLPALHTWREIGELRRRVRFVVLARHGEEDASGFPVIRRPLAISSTEIRNRVAKGESVRYFLPQEVIAIIARHHLYRTPPSLPKP